MASCFSVFCRFSVSFLRAVFVLLIPPFLFVNVLSITYCGWCRTTEKSIFQSEEKLASCVSAESQSHGHGVESHSGLAFPFFPQLSCRCGVAKRRWFSFRTKNIKHCFRKLRSNIWICGKFCVIIPLSVKMFILKYINTTYVLCSTLFRSNQRRVQLHSTAPLIRCTPLIGSGTSCATTSTKDGSFQCLH